MYIYIRKNDFDLFVEQQPFSRLRIQINRKEYDMIPVLKDGDMM